MARRPPQTICVFQSGFVEMPERAELSLAWRAGLGMRAHKLEGAD
jgi:hypothetical protein